MQFFRSVIDSPLTHDFLMGAWIAPILPREEEEEVVPTQKPESTTASVNSSSSSQKENPPNPPLKKEPLSRIKFLSAKGEFLLNQNFCLGYILTKLAASQKNNQARF